MAKRRNTPLPSEDKDTFLGGGMQFNKVGTSIPGSAPADSSEEPVELITPHHARTQKTRTALIIVALLVLVALLFVLSSDSLSGLRHVGGRGGISAGTHPAAPPRNF